MSFFYHHSAKSPGLSEVPYSNCRYIVLDTPFLLAEDPVVGGYEGKHSKPK